MLNKMKSNKVDTLTTVINKISFPQFKVKDVIYLLKIYLNEIGEVHDSSAG